jgi:hypothetical protein
MTKISEIELKLRLSYMMVFYFLMNEVKYWFRDFQIKDLIDFLDELGLFIGQNRFLRKKKNSVALPSAACRPAWFHWNLWKGWSFLTFLYRILVFSSGLDPVSTRWYKNSLIFLSFSSGWACFDSIYKLKFLSNFICTISFLTNLICNCLMHTRLYS